MLTSFMQRRMLLSILLVLFARPALANAAGQSPLPILKIVALTKSSLLTIDDDQHRKVQFEFMDGTHWRRWPNFLTAKNPFN